VALYGGDMVDVSTPDGRRLTVPSQFAAQFPELQPIQPMGQQLAPAPPLELQPPTEVAGPSTLMTPEAGAVPMPADTAPPSPAQPPGPAFAMPALAAQMPATTAQPQGGPVASPSQAAGPSNPAPQAQPRPEMTNAGLSKLGNAGVYNAEQGALDQKGQAIRNAAQVDADDATRVGNAMAARDAETQRILEERAKAAADNQARLESKMVEYEQNAKAIADTKIDRSIDHPILAAIGVALGAIGAAMNKQQGNPALDMLLKSIDRKVAAQVQDLEIKRGSLAVQRDGLNMQREAGKDRLADIDQRRVAAIDQATRQIETIKAQSGSDRTKANADLTLAGLAQERVKTLDSAMQREQAKLAAEQERKDKLLMHKQSIGVQYAGLSQQDRHFKLDYAEKVRSNMANEFMTQEARELAARQAEKAGKVELGKEIMKRAVGGEVTPVKDKDGNVVDYKVGLLTTRNGEVWVPQGEESVVADFQKKHDAVVSYISTLDAIKREGPEYLTDIGNSEKYQRLKQLMGQARLQAIQVNGLGVPTGHDIELAEDFIGTPDPTRWRDSIAGLTQSRSSIVRDHNATLKGRGYDKVWDPPDMGQKAGDLVPNELQSRTPAELASNTKRGTLGNVVETVLNPIGESPAERRAREESPNASTARPGFTEEQARTVDAQLRAYRQFSSSQDPVTQGKAKQPADILVGIAADTSRPARAQAMLSSLKQDAPELYQQALARLPAQDGGNRNATPVPNRQAIAEHEQTVMAMQPVGLLHATAAAGDAAAKQELARRAADGDKDAARAVVDLVKNKGVR
jgi:hypothetical protein